ncbi:MAG: alpha/beta fold hydrolase, partial [Pseudomonadota bacterium]|nr:alpha/beta fold hydrolase [Pseudomonadota bacterium]
NGLAIEVEDEGRRDGDPLLLIMGVGMQLTGWPDGFVAELARRGFRVIRFDNRDIGLSEGRDSAGVPNIALASMRYLLGLPVAAPYALADMAEDAAGVLDALGIERAHVCAASMGGMIAQHLAARHPERVKSLTLMMTTSGARHLPKPSWAVQRAFLAKPRGGGDLEGIAGHFVRLFDIIGSPEFRVPPEEARRRSLEFVKRSWHPAGGARQMLAILADGDRSEMLKTIHVPTHVIHGAVDPLIPVAAGRDVAARIPGATLDIIEGLGHDLPQQMWPRFADGIVTVAARAPA